MKRGREYRAFQSHLPDSRSGLTWIEIIVLIAIFVVLLALWLPSQQNIRGVSKQTLCKNNLKQIMLALHFYAETYGVFPPAYTVDDQGNRLHSWRTLILPYLDHQQTYDKVDFSKPWDDPANDEARQTIITAYVCPTFKKSINTSYLAVVTEDSFFHATRGAKLTEVTDDPDQTVAIIEVDHEKSVEWMKPSDADESLVKLILIEPQLNHPAGSNIALANGGVRFTPHKVLRKEQVHALITASGNDEVGGSED